MIDFIIYDDDVDIKSVYYKIIHKYMLNKTFDYRIITFNEYNVKIKDIIYSKENRCKVYLLDIEVPIVSGIDLAHEIRNSGDWKSQIIFLTAYKNKGKKYINLTNRLLSLDFIFKNNMYKDLSLCLDIILKIFSTNKVLSFRYNGEIIKVFYKNIYYIEKNLYNNDSTIVTKDSKYTIRSSINSLIERLGNDNRFFKSHRSCIINLDNVIGYDISNNIILFEDDCVNLIARSKKKELRELLNNDDTYNNIYRKTKPKIIK